jgi:hypothetical protein
MKMHCIYCGERADVAETFKAIDAEVRARMLAFMALHDARCGEKSIGMIVELPARDSAPVDAQSV